MFEDFFKDRIPFPFSLLYSFGTSVLKPLQEIREEVACEIASSVKSGTILEIGSGPANCPISILSKNPCVRIVGVDSSAEIVSVARKNIFKAGLQERISVFHMDGNRLSFPDNHFDYAFTLFSYHHFKNPERVLNELYRVLKPAGIAWIYDGFADIPLSRIRRLKKKYSFPFNILPSFFIKTLISTHGVKKKVFEEQVKRSDFRKCRVYLKGLFFKAVLEKEK